MSETNNVRIESPYGVPSVARFEKVSMYGFKSAYLDTYTQVQKQLGNIKEDETVERDDPKFTEVVDNIVHNLVSIPKRVSKLSPDYYISFPFAKTVITPGNSAVIPTGIKCYIGTGWFGQISIEESLNPGLVLAGSNNTLQINSEYYNNNINEGNIIIGVTNISKEPITLEPGQIFAKMIFVPFAIATNDEIFSEEDLRQIAEINNTESDAKPVEETDLQNADTEEIESVEGEVVE